jgi:hypothetical protein
MRRSCFDLPTTRAKGSSFKDEAERAFPQRVEIAAPKNGRAEIFNQMTEWCRVN